MVGVMLFQLLIGCVVDVTDDVGARLTRLLADRAEVIKDLAAVDRVIALIRQRTEAG